MQRYYSEIFPTVTASQPHAPINLLQFRPHSIHSICHFVVEPVQPHRFYVAIKATCVNLQFICVHFSVDLQGDFINDDPMTERHLYLPKSCGYTTDCGPIHDEESIFAKLIWLILYTIKYVSIYE